jgi:hypothetical protein
MRKCQSYKSILVKLVRGDIINREYELYVVFPSLFNECCDVVCPSCVKQGITDLRYVA